MDVGEKLRAARLEAGLTQRQLSEGLVTRNMLSLIENGNAKPSMMTLVRMAQRLGKPVGYFLEDEEHISGNRQLMEQARALYDSGNFEELRSVLEEYRQPDPVFDREQQLLETACLLALARKAIEAGKQRYARELLDRADTDTAYCSQQLERERLLLLGSLSEVCVSGRLPSLDRELRLRSREALEAGEIPRAAALLEACEEKESTEWLLLRGKVWMAEKKYAQADKCLTGAEKSYPRETAQLLEICCKELGDYRRAYEYACKQK